MLGTIGIVRWRRECQSIPIDVQAVFRSSMWEPTVLATSQWPIGWMVAHPSSRPLSIKWLVVSYGTLNVRLSADSGSIADVAGGRRRGHQETNGSAAVQLPKHRQQLAHQPSSTRLTLVLRSNLAALREVASRHLDQASSALCRALARVRLGPPRRGRETLMQIARTYNVSHMTVAR